MTATTGSLIKTIGYIARFHFEYYTCIPSVRVYSTTNRVLVSPTRVVVVDIDPPPSINEKIFVSWAA